VEGPVYMYVRDTLVLIVERHICMYVSPRFLCRPTAFFRLASAMGHQRALHTENSGFVAATLRRHISTFRGYRKPLYKSLHQSFFYSFITILHSITARFCLRSSFRHVDSFSNLQTWSRDTNWMMTATHCMMGAT
jgi:hypothetical protein